MKRKGLLTILMSAGLAFVILAAPFSSECAAEAQKQRVLSHATFLPEVAAQTPGLRQLFKGIEDASGGAVKTEFHWSSSLGGPRELYSMTVDRLADTATVVPQYTPGIFPMFSIFELPIQFPSAEVLTAAAIKMYKKGYFDKEFDKIKVLGLYAIAPYIFQCRDDRITKIEDFKGLKVRASGSIPGKMVKAFGAVPVQTTTAEMYSNLLKGVTDVEFSPLEAILIFKTREIIKYVNEWRTFTSGFVTAMNKDVWNDLPQEAKQYVENNWEDCALKCAAGYDLAHDKAKELFLKEPGKEIINFAPGEREKMDRLLAPLWNDWIADMDKKGLPGKQAIHDLYEILADLGIKEPFVGYAPR